MIVFDALQTCIVTHESNGIDIITALILNDISPLCRYQIEMVLQLKVPWCSQWLVVTVDPLILWPRCVARRSTTTAHACLLSTGCNCSLSWWQDNASKLLLALMESRHDSENAERILFNLRPRELVRL